MTQDEQRFAVITDRALESLRGLIGVPITDTVEPWCYEVTRDNIRHYAHGIGEDLEQIWKAYQSEAIRGATPRYVQDVTVGEELPNMTKGPMTVTGFINYAQGWGGLYIRANRLAYKQLRKHSGLGIADRFGIP